MNKLELLLKTACQRETRVVTSLVVVCTPVQLDAVPWRCLQAVVLFQRALPRGPEARQQLCHSPSAVCKQIKASQRQHVRSLVILAVDRKAHKRDVQQQQAKSTRSNLA